MLDAREASAKLQRETAAARAEAAAAHEALEYERAEADQLRSANELMQQELSRLKVALMKTESHLMTVLPLFLILYDFVDGSVAFQNQLSCRSTVVMTHLQLGLKLQRVESTSWHLSEQ